MFQVPTNCPSCGFELEMDGGYLKCCGPTCPAQVVGSLNRWVGKLRILNIGNALIQALVDAGRVSDISGLYRLEESWLREFEIDGRKVGGNARRVVASLNAARDIPVDMFVGSLGIPLCGRKMVSILVDAGYDDLSKLAKVTTAQMEAVPGFGAERARSFRAGFDACRSLMLQIMASGVDVIAPVRAVATGDAMAGQAVCFTGVRDKEASAAIVDQGGKIASGVSKNTTLLVAKNPASTSGKAKKARALGIEIISQAEMRSRLGL